MTKLKDCLETNIWSGVWSENKWTCLCNQTHSCIIIAFFFIILVSTIQGQFDIFPQHHKAACNVHLNEDVFLTIIYSHLCENNFDSFSTNMHLQLTNQPFETINHFRVSLQLNVDDKKVCISLKVMCLERFCVFGADQWLSGCYRTRNAW